MAEYPFKDLLPLEEVLEREGYYTDWTHLDPEVFYSLTQISEYIKTKGYGVDVRLLIAQLAEHFSLKTSQINEIERIFNDVMKELSEEKDYHSLPEISAARGGHETLGARLDETTAQLAQKAKQIDLDVERKRIDNIVGLPPTIDNAETTDIRVGADGVTYDSAGSSVRSQLDINNLNISKVDVEWIKGFYVNNLGVLTPYAPIDNVRYTKIFIPNGTTSIITNAVSGLAGNFGYYDIANNLLKIENKNAVGVKKIGLPENTHYVLLTNIFGGPGVVNASPYVIFNNVQHTAFSNVVNEINKINDNITNVGENKLKGKKLSVLADSISTFTGKIPSGYLSQYPNGDVTTFDKTWVGKLLNKTEMELEVLNAWAGTRVTNTGSFPIGSHFVDAGRWDNLGNPDVIIVFGGTNDLFQTNPPMLGEIPNYSVTNMNEFDLTKFSSAYLYLLMNLKKKYTNAIIYCCSPTDFTRDITSPYWKNSNGVSKQDIAKTIKKCCDIVGATHIDLLKCGISYYNYSKFAYDGDLHPNALGMEYIAEHVYSKIN